VAILATIVLLFLKEIPLKGGGAPAASTMEGGEALLQEDSAELLAEAWADADSAPEDPREPVLVGAGRHSLASENGHGQYKPAATALPVAKSVPTPSFNSPLGNGGHPVTGHVRRQDGSPVSGAAMTLIDQRGRQVARATGNADGSYTISSPGNGTYVLIVSAAGHQPQASSVLISDVPANLDLTLTGSGILTGVVRQAGKGVPVAGATVTLTDGRGEVTGASITQADGVYSFNGVGAGQYTLVVSGGLYRPIAVSLTVPDSGVVNHDVELTGAVLLTGAARTEDGKVVPDARITVIAADGNVSAVARTDAEGRYVVSDLPEGSYTVVASGYPPATSQVELAGGTEANHDVRLGYEQALDEFAGVIPTAQVTTDSVERP
jgi:uncharacterized protein YfaS (alpha-2-macroglobulin family)